MFLPLSLLAKVLYSTCCILSYILCLCFVLYFLSFPLAVFMSLCLFNVLDGIAIG